MKAHRCYRTLLALVLAVLIGLPAGCASAHQQRAEQSASPPAPVEGASATEAAPEPQPPVINSMMVGPQTIDSGDSVLLSWDVSGATTVTIEPTVGSVGRTGAEELSPAARTTYVLTATNEAGTSTRSVTVAVRHPDDAPADPGDTLVGCDPVSGRNQEVDLDWEQLCLSSEYQVQIAKDPGFTLIVLDTGAFAPASATSPAAYYPAGGAVTNPAQMGSALTPGGVLEAGHTYYWRVRVRQAATGQIIRSPWSPPKAFTIGAGLPATSSSRGLQALHPANTCSGCPVKPVSFSWSPFKETTRYRFMLANDAACTDIIAEAEVSGTAYEYDGTLNHAAAYFWRVMALEPAPSDWSATFSFHTEAAPPAAPAMPEPTSSTPLWAWVAIAVGGGMVVVIIVLIFMVRQQ